MGKRRDTHKKLAVAIAVAGGLLAIFPRLPDQLQIFGAVIGAISLGFAMSEHYFLAVMVNPVEFRIRSDFEKHSLLQKLAKQHYDLLLVNVELGIDKKRMSFHNGEEIIAYLCSTVPVYKMYGITRILAVTNFCLPGRNSDDVRKNILDTTSSLQSVWDNHFLSCPASVRVFLYDSDVEQQPLFKTFKKHIESNKTLGSYHLVNTDKLNDIPSEDFGLLKSDFVLFFMAERKDTFLCGASSEKARSNQFDGFFEQGDQKAFAVLYQRIRAIINNTQD